MNKTAERIALCRWAGWKVTTYSCGVPPEPTPMSRTEGWDILPDTNSLDVLAEFEARLKSEYGHLSAGNLHRNYLLHLMDIVNPGVTLWKNGEFLGAWSNAIKTAEATPEHRREALCRALKLEVKYDE